jgi:hypothetical protein
VADAEFVRHVSYVPTCEFSFWFLFQSVLSMMDYLEDVEVAPCGLQVLG